MTGRRTLVVAGLAAALTAGWLVGEGARQATAQQTHRLRIQTAVPSSSMYFELLKNFGARVEKMSGGRVKTEVLPDGAVVQAFEILDAVDKGIVEGGYAWTHYWSGKHPAAGIFSNPAAGAGTGMDQLSHVAWLYQGGGYDLYKQFYAEILKVNVEPFLVQPMGPDPLGWFKSEIKSVEDFRKLKYRAPPGINGEIFKTMGIPATALPGGEIVPGAQRGVIDAAEWIGPADDMNLGLHTVWKNYYLQGLHQSTDVGEVLINKTFWNKLPPDVQEIIRGAALASMMETYTYQIARNAQAVKLLREKHGVKILDTPKDFYPQFVKAANQVFDKYAAQDPFFKKVLDSQRAFAKDVVPYWTKINALYTYVGESSPNAR